MLILDPLASFLPHSSGLTISPGFLQYLCSFPRHTHPSSTPAPPLSDPIYSQGQTCKYPIQLSKPFKRSSGTLPTSATPSPFVFLLLYSDYTQLPGSLRSDPEVLPPSLKGYFIDIFFPFPISAPNPP